MTERGVSRRNFLSLAGAFAGSAAVRGPSIFGHSLLPSPQGDTAADYTVKIASSSVEIAPKRTISAITYNGQFPGPLLRFKEGQQVSYVHDSNIAEPESVLAKDKSPLQRGWSILARCWSRQEFLVDLGDDDIVGVDHFVQMDFGSFRQQLVGIHFG
jgi:Multicopper oxidase